MVPSDEKKPNCDKSKRNEIAGGLEYLRMSRVCKVYLNDTSRTDKDGRATFQDFKMSRGPQGFDKIYTNFFFFPLKKKNYSKQNEQKKKYKN